MADATTLSDQQALNEAIFSKLSAIIHDYSEPTDRNVDVLLAAIASCGGKHTGFDMSSLWRKIGKGQNAMLIDQLRSETMSGRKHYQDILRLFDSSVPTLFKNDIERILAAFFSQLRPGLEAYVKGGEPLPIWTPKSGSPHAEFLTGLQIPVTKEGRPDMLLHGLGTDPSLEELLMAIFGRNVLEGTLQTTLLLNTSGSGKTRMMLEGLCRYWGLYFTCQVDGSGHGSIDMQNTLSLRIGQDPSFTAELPRDLKARTVVHEQNIKIAQDRIREVLLARLYIFNLFCEVVGSNPTDDHKRLWVILQIRPTRVSRTLWDIFEDLTRRIKGIDFEYRDEQIWRLTHDLRARLTTQAGQPPFFCVIDESQTAASGPTSFSRAFMSHENPAVLRPVIREVARSVVMPAVPIALNITGTGIDKSVIAEVFTSAVLKERKRTTVTNIGAFDTEESQRRYMERHMPPILTMRPWTLETTAFFEKAFYWLQGRYRFTATFLQELLVRNFEKPHEVLNSYIMRCTQVPVTIDFSEGFTPTDGQSFLTSEPRAVERWDTFDFRRMAEDPILLKVLRESTMKYWMRSNLSAFPMTFTQYELVVAGFARYSEITPDTSRITIDEPLAVLALCEWLRIRHVPFAEDLRSRAAIAVTEATGANGLEEYLAFYFNTVFDDRTPLDTIFKFPPGRTPEWATHPASLVSLYFVNQSPKGSTEENGHLEEGRVQENSRPSVCLGYDGTSEDILNWLSHRDRAPFCFPDTLMGPDIMFILKLGNEQRSRIWVAVQSKFHSGSELFPAARLKEALASVQPANFYMKKHPKEAQIKDETKMTEQEKKKAMAAKQAEETKERNREELRGKALRYIDALPGRLPHSLGEPGEEGAGTHSVLRVVVAWPGHPSLHDRSTLSSLRSTYHDEDGHPVVEIDTNHWGDTMDRLHPKTTNFIDETVDFYGANKGMKRPPGGTAGVSANKKTKVGPRSPGDVLGIPGPSDPFIPLRSKLKYIAGSEAPSLGGASANTFGSPPPPTEASDHFDEGADLGLDSPFLPASEYRDSDGEDGHGKGLSPTPAAAAVGKGKRKASYSSDYE
ncbi:hypothetical protein DFH09DRAFT_1069139 [Mycena vulgaris]|nr:hypothetical protein DFH09DRAFT_1069139 [Mycena vulgaris]